MNTKIARILVLALIALLAFLVVMPFLRLGEFADKEVVVHESLQCITAVCVDDTQVGTECKILSPSVSKVLITVSDDDSRHRVLRVEPTEAECR